MGWVWRGCQVTKWGGWPRTRPHRTWLAVDSGLCVNGRCWKVLSKEMLYYFHSSSTAVWRLEYISTRVETETSWELLHSLCGDMGLTGTKKRKRVCIIPLWCSIWSKTCVLLAIQIKLLHISPLCFTSNCVELFWVGKDGKWIPSTEKWLVKF